MKIQNLFNKETLLEALKEMQNKIEAREDNFEISAYFIFKKASWLKEALEEYQKGRLYILDREKSNFDFETLKVKTSFSTEKVSSKDELIRKFDEEFLENNIFPLIPLLKETSNITDKELWDIIQFNIFSFLGIHGDRDELYIYLKNKYKPFKIEIREMLDPTGEEHILVRNTCCGKYKTNIEDYCRVCPLING